VTFYPGLAQADMTIMDKSAAQVDAAIKAKDRAAFVQLTETCNSCHQSQGYGFIVVRMPTASLHTNQIFTPQ
jgi:hypothetical protein